MAKATTQFVCQSCGTAHRKWNGQCSDCGGWNTLVEESGLTASGPPSKSLGAARGRKVELSPLSGSEPAPPRLSSGIAEFDRVLGLSLIHI